ncbi:hypothetical protein TRIP_B360007 [uncultured Desulfatiglans sp.]|nr:hypothetical protein TRIP_B360007 [uncultured Desulfatiglans sp.]
MNTDLISQCLNNSSASGIPAIQTPGQLVFENKPYHPVLTDPVKSGNIFCEAEKICLEFRMAEGDHCRGEVVANH